MTHAECLAGFVAHASYDELSPETRQELKARVLDSLGCAIGAVDAEPIKQVRDHIAEFGGAGPCTLIGGGQTAPDRAAMYNGALVRYLDFMDSYLTKGKICHPSDNLAAVMAAAEYANRSGKDLLTALAVAYQVQCRLTEEVLLMPNRFDQTTQLAYSAAAGVAKALDLDATRTAHALAIAGASCLSLSVIRTGPVSQWKGLASAYTASSALHGAFLARRGITGPLGIFEGPKGFLEATESDFEIEWAAEDLDRVTHTVVKKYDAQVYAQSAIDAIIELRNTHSVLAEEIELIEVETFHAAYEAIGGGAFGERTLVATREQADHSLPYLLAVAVLDGDVMPEQYRPQRIARADVQDLLRKVKVSVNRNYTRYYPAEMCCQIRITLRDGRKLACERKDYEGFFTRPMPWDRVVNKFDRLAEPRTDAALRKEIVAAVANLESIGVVDLARLLAKVQAPAYKQPAEAAAPAKAAETPQPWQDVPLNLLHA